jgi:hypothetical protein
MLSMPLEDPFSTPFAVGVPMKFGLGEMPLVTAGEQLRISKLTLIQ